MSDTYKLSLETEEDLAQKIFQLLDPEISPAKLPFESAAIGYFELLNHEWCVEVYFSGYPDIEQFRSYLQSQLNLATLPKLKLAPVANLDWVSHAQKFLSPVRCGRFVCYGSHDRGSVFINRFAIQINAGQAFGTSHHGTTQGCLNAIDRLAKRYAFKRIVDIGTGTGILAIAASKCWPGITIIATELDPLAVAIAKQNCALNSLRNRILVLQANGLKHPEIQNTEPYHLILANILAGPLKRMAGDISKHLKPGGVAILSGILDSQSSQLEARYRLQGLTLETRICLEGWTTLIMTKS